MYGLGMALFLVSTVILFGSDIMARRGKIRDAKQMLKFKIAGVGMLLLSVIFMLLK